MIFLAVSDLTFLYSSVIRILLLQLAEFDIKNTSFIACIFQPWLAFTSLGFSAWLLVFLTADRALFIVWPLNARLRITRRKAVVSSVALLLVLSLYTSFILFTYEIREIGETETRANETVVIKNSRVCVPKDGPLIGFRNGLWNILTMVIMYAIPMLIITIGDIIAATVLFRQNRKRIAMVGNETPSVLDAKMADAAKMLLFICSFSLITTTPYSSFNIFKRVFFGDADQKTHAKLQLAHTIAYMMLCCNFTCNFWLYTVRGSLFKTELDLMVASLLTKYNAFKKRITNTGDNANNLH